MSLARFSVRNPVPVNLLMVAILALGSVSFMALPRELMTDISFHWVFITKAYPGVSAEEIERLITVPIEDEIRDVKGIDFVASYSAEGVSFLSVKFRQMSDEEFRARFADIRAEIDKVKDLPEDALDTEVMNFGSADFGPLIAVHLYSGHTKEKDLIQLSRDLREELLNIPQVAKVQLVGVRDREVWIEADPTKLSGFAISLEQLQAAIAARVNVPAGRVSIGRQELLVRSLGEYGDAAEIEKVIVRSMPDGRKVRVGDIAKVRDTFEEERTRSRLNNKPVISLMITKRNQGNSIVITDEAKRIAKEFGERHRSALQVAFTQDSSEHIKDMLSKLTSNAWLGLFVVLLLLLLVLGFRNAVLAGLGIPISFLACFIFMYQTGESFNGNSLFGLVLVLGIIVDDAIMVVENCYRHLQMGKSWREAAIDGTDEVMRPILSATATTIAAFLPLILLPGIMGKFMRIIPITVSLALLASMVEAFVILPSHFADWPGKRLQAEKERGWLTRLRESYERALRYVIGRRKRFVALVVLVVIPAAGALVPAVGVEMFAGEEINTFQVRVTMPTGTNLDATSKTLGEFERAARQLPAGEVRAVHATAGLTMTDAEWVFRSDLGEMWLDLSMSYQRKRTTDEIMDDLRARLNKIVGPVNIEFAKLNTGPPLGKPVEVKVKGKYLDKLEAVADELKAFIQKLDGTVDVGDDFRAGSKEVRLRVDPDKASLYGLSVGQVGLAIRAAIDGLKAGKMYDGDEEIELVVRVDKRFFSRLEDLLRLPVVLPAPPGGATKTITLGEVASYNTRPSYADIRRYKNQRAITVFANIDKQKTTALEVNGKIKKQIEKIRARYAGVTFDFSGELEEFKESFGEMGKLFLFGVLLIYVILGAQFRSYRQPIVILFTVPFSFVGAMVGLLVSGNPFSIATLFGMVALAGVAVNDAIVLISFVNNAREEGMTAEEAVVHGARLRLRPIILTSLTTIAGLLPMAMGLGGMSKSWSPFANTIVWGLAVGTFLTLFLIPAVYLVLVKDLTRKSKRPQV